MPKTLVQDHISDHRPRPLGQNRQVSRNRKPSHQKVGTRRPVKPQKQVGECHHNPNGHVDNQQVIQHGLLLEEVSHRRAKIGALEAVAAISHIRIHQYNSPFFFQCRISNNPNSIPPRWAKWATFPPPTKPLINSTTA